MKFQTNMLISLSKHPDMLTEAYGPKIPPNISQKAGELYEKFQRLYREESPGLLDVDGSKKYFSQHAEDFLDLFEDIKTLYNDFKEYITSKI